MRPQAFPQMLFHDIQHPPPVLDPFNRKIIPRIQLGSSGHSRIPESSFSQNRLGLSWGCSTSEHP